VFAVDDPSLVSVSFIYLLVRLFLWLIRVALSAIQPGSVSAYVDWDKVISALVSYWRCFTVINSSITCL